MLSIINTSIGKIIKFFYLILILNKLNSANSLKINFISTFEILKYAIERNMIEPSIGIYKT